MSLKQEIYQQAHAIGFDQVGFTKPSGLDWAGRMLRRFVEFGRHGDMHWLSKNVERRANPLVLWPSTKSVIVVAKNYGQGSNPLSNLSNTNIGSISVYARNRDYHQIVKGRLKQLGLWMANSYSADVKVFVDTAAVMEKPLAAAAGLGWQGKHTNLVSREFGSWTFLGVIFTTLDIPSDQRGEDSCGSCRSCLDVCPTNAFPEPYQLDATRCISYLTIEHKGQIAKQFRQAIGNRIFGCDDCLAVCPWNKFAQRTRELKLLSRKSLLAPDLRNMATLNDEEFRLMFSGSPIKRIGRDRFIRNVLVALGNSGNSSLASVASSLFRDSSPLVRGMAVWAWRRLVSSDEFTKNRGRYLAEERDPEVVGEWE